MSYIVLGILYRKPHLSPAEFKAHYENIHLPLLKTLLGDAFPTSHSRRYIQRASEPQDTPIPGTQGERYPATVLQGEQADVEYDALMELRFESEEHLGRFIARSSEEKIGKELLEDDDLFLDRERGKVVIIGSVEE